jgi:hypothetical protein
VIRGFVVITHLFSTPHSTWLYHCTATIAYRRRLSLHFGSVLPRQRPKTLDNQAVRSERMVIYQTREPNIGSRRRGCIPARLWGRIWRWCQGHSTSPRGPRRFAPRYGVSSGLGMPRMRIIPQCSSQCPSTPTTIPVATALWRAFQIKFSAPPPRVHATSLASL